MPEYAVYVIAALAVAALAAGGALLARYLWGRAVRGRVVSLVGRYEAVAAGERQLRAVVMHLADCSDTDLVAYAMSPDNEDRHLLGDVAERMGHECDELMALALPKSLWAAADVLADAAWRVGLEAERATKGNTPDEVLVSLSEVDLAAVREAVAQAEEAVGELRTLYDVQEAVVYGGGLYI